MIPIDDRKTLTEEIKVQDSKTLQAYQRENQFKQLCTNETLSWIVIIMSPQYISRCMLSKHPNTNKNLNQISFEAAFTLIKNVQEYGEIDELYVDTVGSEHSYRQRLHDKFPTISKVCSNIYIYIYIINVYFYCQIDSCST